MMKIRDCEIKVIQGDITELKVDAIVNAANNRLVMGGGVAGAIKRKGGRAIEEEAVDKGPIEIGEAVCTSGGNLKAKYVIHAATMGMDLPAKPVHSQLMAGPRHIGSRILLRRGKTDEIKIRNSCRNALKIAERLKIGSVAFPALGCGVGGFPILAAAKIITQETFKHLKENKSNLKEVTFCLYDKETYDVFNKNVFSYLGYITTKLENGPFTTVDAIIEMEEGIVVIERKNPPFGWALPGGFVDYGESLEEAVKRESKEETDLELFGLKQFHTYSEPNRDPRFHTIATVFIANGKGRPKAGDDAAKIKIIRLDEVDKLNFAFDHKKVVGDYMKFKNGKSAF